MHANFKYNRLFNSPSVDEYYNTSNSDAQR
jgi:hypothetical protein